MTTADKKKKFPVTLYVKLVDDGSEEWLSADGSVEGLSLEHGDLVAVYEIRGFKRVKMTTDLIPVPRRKKSTDEIVKEARESLGL